MDNRITREFKVFIPIFAVLILISLGLDYIKPETVPAGFTIEGIATKLIKKADLPYHIPILELIIYVIGTLVQFHFEKTRKELAKFAFDIKLGTILLIGISMPVASYLYTVNYINNIWYVIGVALSIYVFYIFFLLLFSGFLDFKKKSKISGVAIPSKKKKKRR